MAQSRPKAVSADENPSRNNSPRSKGAPSKLWLFRALAALGIPAALFLGLEAGLRIAGFGQSVQFLIPDSRAGFLRSNPEFVSSFLPGSFDLRPLNFVVEERKPANTVRVVVLGESAAQGIPVPAFGFAPQLRAQLRTRFPGRNIEVINTGIVAINSHVVYKIARELGGISPDLFVVYMGNNEVVGPYGPGCAYLSQMPPLWFIRLSVAVRSTRTGQLVSRALARLGGSSHKPEEWGGMSMFVNNAVSGDDPRLRAVYQNFESNLRDIVRVASRSGATTLLCTVASNLSDCAPLLSIHRPGMSQDELERWGKIFRRGRIEWKAGDFSRAYTDLAETELMDPHYADCEFMMGSIELGRGEVEAARRHFLSAQHWDALRFRPDERINQIIRQVAGESGRSAVLVDIALGLGSDPKSVVPPAGRGIFFEHVHFDWPGNYEVARKMAEACANSLGPAPGPAPAWLDSEACAAALGYTDRERFTVLEKVAGIIQNPPFTNQLTYCEDQARLSRDLARSKADRNDPEKLVRSESVVRAALAADPSNSDLIRILEDIEDQRGNVDAALALSMRAQQVQPQSYALAADEAIKRSRLGHYDEAKAILDRTAVTCSPRDLALMAPAYADLYSRSRRFAEGRAYLDRLVFGRPGDPSLRLIRARFERVGGDPAAAEEDYRSILRMEPGNQAALEELIGMLGGAGEKAQAEEIALAGSVSQVGNQTNQLRSAIIFDTRHDEAQALRCLLAAERSGPFTTGAELNLARRLLRLGRPVDALEHLAEARRISAFEADRSASTSIESAIERIMVQMR